MRSSDPAAALALTHVPTVPSSDQADLIKDGDSDGGAWEARVDYDNALHGAEWFDHA